MSSSNQTLNPPITLTGQNYHIWSVKMQSFLEVYELWDIVTQDIPIPPLRENPTLAQIKSYNEEKAKRSKVKSLIQNSVADSVFYRIMACSTAKESWDRLSLKLN